jgi:hypothetical protein
MPTTERRVTPVVVVHGLVWKGPALLDRLVHAPLPGGWAHEARELRRMLQQRPERGLAASQWRRVQWLSERHLNADGTPRTCEVESAAWLALADRTLRARLSSHVRTDLRLMRDLIAERPELPLPPTWPEAIGRAALGADVLQGAA